MIRNSEKHYKRNIERTIGVLYERTHRRCIVEIVLQESAGVGGIAEVGPFEVRSDIRRARGWIKTLVLISFRRNRHIPPAKQWR